MTVPLMIEPLQAILKIYMPEKTLLPFMAVWFQETDSPLISYHH